MNNAMHRTYEINIRALVLTYVEASEAPTLDGALDFVSADLGHRLTADEDRIIRAEFAALAH